MRRHTARTRDLSTALLWMPFTPIGVINDTNRDAVAKWLEDRSVVLIWLTSIITGSLVLITLFGKKLGVDTPSQVFLSIGVLLLFAAVLLNVMCVWQIPKWKFAVRTNQIADGHKMVWDLELGSWLSLCVFLAGLVLITIGSMF